MRVRSPAIPSPPRVFPAGANNYEKNEPPGKKMRTLEVGGSTPSVDRSLRRKCEVDHFGRKLIGRSSSSRGEGATSVVHKPFRSFARGRPILERGRRKRAQGGRNQDAARGWIRAKKGNLKFASSSAAVGHGRQSVATGGRPQPRFGIVRRKRGQSGPESATPHVAGFAPRKAIPICLARRKTSAPHPPHCLVRW
jgi:hypothetical protein